MQNGTHRAVKQREGWACSVRKASQGMRSPCENAFQMCVSSLEGSGSNSGPRDRLQPWLPGGMIQHLESRGIRLVGMKTLQTPAVSSLSPARTHRGSPFTSPHQRREVWPPVAVVRQGPQAVYTGGPGKETLTLPKLPLALMETPGRPQPAH